MNKKIILTILSCIFLNPVASAFNTPEGIQDAKGYNEYQKYLKEKNQKAFAVSEYGAVSWVARLKTLSEAKESAIKNCIKYNNGQCKIIDENGQLLVAQKNYDGFLEKFKNNKQFFPSDILDVSLANRYKNEYLNKPGNKAFAIGEKATAGWVINVVSIDIAKKRAMQYCNKNNKGNTKACKIIDVNGDIVFSKTKFSDMTLAKNTVYPDITGSIDKKIAEKEYKKYQIYNGHKAYAVIPDGRGYYIYNKTNKGIAKKVLLESCEKYYKQKCNLILLDNKIINSETTVVSTTGDLKDRISKPTKPWHASYSYDYSKHQDEFDKLDEDKELQKAVLDSLTPTFKFTNKTVQIFMGENILENGTYILKGKEVVMQFKKQNKGKQVTATFNSDYSSITLESGENPVYYRVKNN